MTKPRTAELGEKRQYEAGESPRLRTGSSRSTARRSRRGRPRRARRRGDGFGAAPSRGALRAGRRAPPRRETRRAPSHQALRPHARRAKSPASDKSCVIAIRLQEARFAPRVRPRHHDEPPCANVHTARDGRHPPPASKSGLKSPSRVSAPPMGSRLGSPTASPFAAARSRKSERPQVKLDVARSPGRGRRRRLRFQRRRPTAAARRPRRSTCGSREKRGRAVGESGGGATRGTGYRCSRSPSRCRALALRRRRRLAREGRETPSARRDPGMRPRAGALRLRRRPHRSREGARVPTSRWQTTRRTARRRHAPRGEFRRVGHAATAAVRSTRAGAGGTTAR